MSHYKSPEEMFPNLFAAEPAKAKPARKASPSDMRLVQFLMRQMGTRRAPAAKPASSPLPPRPTAARPAPAAGRPAASPSRPLPRAAQR